MKESIYMEKSLDLPLREVLSIMQDSIIKQTTYFGVRTLKNPLDAWIYQEIIYEHRPDIIIEIGNASGGSTLYLAHLCDLLGKGKVIGVDITHDNIPEQVKQHPRIELIEGDAVKSFEKVSNFVSEGDRVLVIEDSSHTYENTINVLRKYSVFIKPGDYLIVEDSICHHGLDTGPNPGPYEAIIDFVNENPGFKIDRSQERFLITWNPLGFLKKSEGNKSDQINTLITTTPSRVSQNKVRRAMVAISPPILTQFIRNISNRR